MRGRNQLDDFPEPFLNHIATCALVSNQAIFLVVAVVDGLADRRRLNESRPLLRRHPGRLENGLVDRFRLPELFLGRVESRCEKVVAMPKGPVDELLPVFGNDGLLYIVSLAINATRIVNLADGKITDDSDPFDVADATRREAKPTRKTSMSFVTALGLSARNLMTKKAVRP